ncbi:MAG: hypothetical protein EOP84_06505 [Verrucomicrobiaceae bacterium]|nr:MAG: hypothetical protein EOP84_06505 [Verrucomicrobiaceae bacterium]
MPGAQIFVASHQRLIGGRQRYVAAAWLALRGALLFVASRQTVIAEGSRCSQRLLWSLADVVQSDGEVWWIISGREWFLKFHWSAMNRPP